jgi:hypothetical protein
MTRGGGNLCAPRRSDCHFYSLSFDFQLDFKKNSRFLLSLEHTDVGHPFLHPHLAEAKRQTNAGVDRFVLRVVGIDVNSGLGRPGS